MNVLEKVLTMVQEAKSFPVVVTNKDVNLIEESALVCDTLEAEGYKVDSFVDVSKEIYGIRISK